MVYYRIPNYVFPDADGKAVGIHLSTNTKYYDTWRVGNYASARMASLPFWPTMKVGSTGNPPGEMG